MQERERVNEHTGEPVLTLATDFDKNGDPVGLIIVTATPTWMHVRGSVYTSEHLKRLEEWINAAWRWREKQKTDRGAARDGNG